MKFNSLFSTHQRYRDNPHYRADIDGLRAIAVISVILFHLHITGITGGFVGVDVFFVISGYLITQLIRREVLRTNRFSFANFYERRIRRLGPSLIVLLALSFIVATLMLSPGDMLTFAYALVGSVLFIANIYFYTSTNYFNADVDSKPLLHTWSLSVEEQFYLFWPILLILILRTLPGARVWLALGALTALSLIGALYLSTHDAQAAFYLLPSRVYEFLIGAALVFLPELEKTKRSLANALFLIGLAMIGYSVLCYTEQTPFPSYYAALPCLGAALMIYSGAVARVQVLTGNAFVAYIGRISYQLYLFHWPVIIFYKYIAFSAMTSLDIGIMLAITLVLATLTYHFIDFPLRNGESHTPRQRSNFQLGVAGICALMAVLAASVRADGGWQWRIPQEMRLFTQSPGEFHKKQFGGADVPDSKVLKLGDPKAEPTFIIFGDSFAAQYAYGLTEFLKANHRSAIAFFRNGCLIAPHVTTQLRGQVNRECSLAFNQVLKLTEHNTLPVIYAQSWSSYKDQTVMKTGEKIDFPGEANEDYYRFIIDLIDKVRVAVGKRHLIVAGISPGTQDQKTVARCFRIPNYLPNKCASSVKFDESTLPNGQEFNRAMEKYANRTDGVTFMNPREAVCADGWCHAISHSKIFYSDFSHFSKDGSLYVIEHFGKLIRSLNPKAPIPKRKQKPVVIPLPPSRPIEELE